MAYNQFNRGSIKAAATTNSLQPTDLDNMRTTFIDNDPTTGISIKFPSFNLDVYEKNRFYLLSKSTQIDFSTRWNMRPDYASYDLYGGSEFYWPLLLYLNNIESIEAFTNLETILAPPHNVILDILRDVQYKKMTNGLVDSEIIKKRINPAYIEFPNSKVNTNLLDSNNQLKSNIPVYKNEVTSTEITDQFTLTNLDITNKYVDLSNEVSNISTLVLYLSPFLNTPIKFSYDYTLIYNDKNKLNRISWNPIDIIQNLTSSQFIRGGLGNLIKEGSIIVIKYTTQQIKRIKVN